MLEFFNRFMGESAVFAAPWAVLVVAVILLAVILIFISGNTLKKILRDEEVQITLNEYWVSTDNNGTMLKSKDGRTLRLRGIKKIPIDLENEKKLWTDSFKLAKKTLIETRGLQKTVNGFKWDILLFNVAQTGIELHAYTTLSKSGISAVMNLRGQHEFDSLTIDYDSAFSFLRKKT